MKREALKAEDLSIGYRRRVVAKGLNLVLEKGALTAFIGRNGIGKSTLLKTLTGSLKPLDGNVEIEGISLSQYKKSSLSRVISIVTTDEDLTGGLTLKEFVSLGRTPYTGLMGLLEKTDNEIVAKALRMVGISHLSGKYMGELSDGERQKGMIARALAQTTPIILMDEPFSFLDVASRMEIMRLLSKIAKSENKAVLFSTHEVTQALRMSDKIWLFHPEENEVNATITVGSPEEIVRSGKMSRLFDNPAIEFDCDTLDYRLKEP